MSDNPSRRSTFVDETPDPPKAGENLIFLVLLVATVALQLYAADGAYLFTHYFWLDEIYTHTLVADPYVAHAMEALAHGVETHPPTLYLLLRVVAAVVGNADEVTLRAFSLLAVLLGLWGTYSVLRLTFSALISFVSVLALWCHPIIIWSAFEARFYGPWFAGVAWLAYFLARSRSPSVAKWINVAIGLAAVFVCTIHYLGIISLVLVAGTETVVRMRRGPRFSPGSIIAILCGPLALLACVPMLLRQRAAVTVATWLKPPSLTHVIALVDDVFFHRYMVPLLLVVWLAQLLPVIWWGHPPRLQPAGDFSLQAGLTALFLMPVVAVIFSYVFQSVLVSRYCLPALAALAPATAYLLSRASPIWVVTGAVAVGAIGVSELRTRATKVLEDDKGRKALITEIVAGIPNEEVIFESPEKLYVVCRYAPPEVVSRCKLLDFENGDIVSKYADNSRIFVRDLARKYSEYYPEPGTVKWSDLRSRPYFYLVPSFFAGGALNAVWDDGPYPGFSIIKLSNSIFLVKAKGLPPPAGRSR